MEQTKLSKLQKEILEAIYEYNKLTGRYNVSQKELSRELSKRKPERKYEWSVLDNLGDLSWKIHHRKYDHEGQTDKFRVSFSRSLKRLQDRGLIKIIKIGKQKMVALTDDDGKWKWNI